MGWSDELATVRREIEHKIEQAVIRIFGFTLTSDTTPIGGGDQVESADDSAQGHQKRQRPAVRIEPWGDRGVAPSGLRALSLKLGASNTLWLGLAPQQKYGPTNLKAGDKCLYCSVNGVQIVLQASDGLIYLTTNEVVASADISSQHLLATRGGLPSVVPTNPATAQVYLGRKNTPPPAPGSDDAGSNDESGLLFAQANAGITGEIAQISYNRPYAQIPHVGIFPADSVSAAAVATGVALTGTTPPTQSIVLYANDAASTKAKFSLAIAGNPAAGAGLSGSIWRYEVRGWR